MESDEWNDTKYSDLTTTLHWKYLLTCLSEVTAHRKIVLRKNRESSESMQSMRETYMSLFIFYLDNQE
jgi:hypothetical protein